MTILALLPQLFVMTVIIFMARDTLRFCFTMLFFFKMTGAAFYLLMTTFKGKVGLIMGEKVWNKENHIGITSQVITVAAFALSLLNTGDASMKAEFFGNIVFNLLMACATVTALLLLAECGVALLAGILKLGMSRDKWAWHQQFLQGRCVGHRDKCKEKCGGKPKGEEPHRLNISTYAQQKCG